MQRILNKLRYQSWHRGTRENDLLLGAFADECLKMLTPTEIMQYERLLNYPDGDLYDWLIGRSEGPADLTLIIAKIRVFHT